MRKLAAAVLVVVLLLSVTAVPSEAWGRHGGHGCCWGGGWLPGAIFGGLALGAVAAATFPPYYAYAAPPPDYAAPPAGAHETAAASTPPAPSALQPEGRDPH